MTLPKVSVILNSYSVPGGFNRFPWLEQAIVSVVSQTYQGPIELIIVDDGSENQNEIVEIASKYQVSNLTIKIRLMPHCGNLAIRRNDGLEIATGEYICLLDDDNAMDPARIALCSDHLQKCQECSAVYHLSRYMDPGGNLGELVNFYRTGEVDLDSILHKRNHIDSGEVMVRRSTFDKLGIFDEQCIILEDWDLWRRILTFGNMHFIPHMLSYYRANHPDRRVGKMSAHDQQGMAYVLGKSLKESLKCELVYPQNVASLTYTQVDVGTHIYKALEAGDMINHDMPDVRFIFAPFRHFPESKNAAPGVIKATIHVEDPFAHRMNINFVREGVDWVFTNDEGMLANYGKLNVKRCVMPSISAFKYIEPQEDKDWDVCFVGTPYPERIQFFQQLAGYLPNGIKILLAGADIPGNPGWSTLPSCYAREPRQILPDDVMEIYSKSRIVIALNRLTGESPMTPIRGFMEASSGSCVLMDNRRPAINRYFDIGKEMVTFSDTQDCVNQIMELLRTDKRQSIARAGFERSKAYSYQKRLHYALQCIQASREAVM